MKIYEITEARDCIAVSMNTLKTLAKFEKEEKCLSTD